MSKAVPVTVIVNISPVPPATETGFAVGDALKINGTQFGGDVSNDLTISVTGVDGSGGITSFTSSGTGPDAQNQFTEPAYTYSGVGTGASFGVGYNGTTYTANVVSPGSGYGANETLTIDGANIGGTSSTNDAVIQIDSVDGSGVITAISITGTASNSRAFTNITSATNIIGAAASFNVTVNYNNSYTVTQGNEVGTNYAVGNQILFDGTTFGGQTSTNDLLVTITGVNGAGGITGSVSYTHLTLPTKRIV